MQPITKRKLVALKTKGWKRVPSLGQGWWTKDNEYLYRDQDGFDHTFSSYKQAKAFKQLYMNK